jgi:hypothetical protein
MMDAAVFLADLADSIMNAQNVPRVYHSMVHDKIRLMPEAQRQQIADAVVLKSRRYSENRSI